MCVCMMYECLDELLECCEESVWIMDECLDGVSGFVFGFRFPSSGWSCLYLSGCVYDWCMNVWTNYENAVENLSRMMYESLNGVSGFVLGFRFLSFGWSCLNPSVDVCMNDVWMSERIVRMLWRICLNHVWISEWNVRICFWISFSFF